MVLSVNRAERRAEEKKAKGLNVSSMPRQKPTLKENIRRAQAVKSLRFRK